MGRSIVLSEAGKVGNLTGLTSFPRWTGVFCVRIAWRLFGASGLVRSGSLYRREVSRSWRNVRSDSGFRRPRNDGFRLSSLAGFIVGNRAVSGRSVGGTVPGIGGVPR